MVDVAVVEKKGEGGALGLIGGGVAGALLGSQVGMHLDMRHIGLVGGSLVALGAIGCALMMVKLADQFKSSQPQVRSKA